LQNLSQRLHEREMDIELSSEALDYLADIGFDPVYGARPLKRAIQQYLENPLAQDILSGKFSPADVIQVGVNDKGLYFY